MGLENIVLDGNWEGNLDVYNTTLNQPERETYLRNSPGWSGFVTTNHGGKTIPAGQVVVVRNAEVSGYGATSLLGHANATCRARTSGRGTRIYNHDHYGANGTWKNYTMEGFGWTHVVSKGDTFRNFVYEDAADSPTARSGPEIINYRNDYGRGFTLDGFFFDFRGSSQYSEIVNGNGKPMQPTDGVVITSPERNFATLYKRNGNSQGLVPNNDFVNIDVFVTKERGGRNGLPHLYGVRRGGRAVHLREARRHSGGHG